MQINPDIANIKGTEQPAIDTQILYQALFENANDAIFLMDAEKFVKCNHRTFEMFGCTPEQIIGKTPYDFSPEFQPDGRKSKDKAMEKIQAVIQGQPQFFEWRHQRYDGSAFDAEISLNGLELSGKPFIQATVRDITKHRRLKDKLKTSEEKYKTLVEHVNEIIFMHDSDFILTYISPQCEKITGYTAQELVGQKWDSYATDNPINKLALDLFEQAKETGAPPEAHHVELLKKDGDVILLEVNDRILRNEKGDVIGVVGSARDITERKIIENALRESEQRLSSIIEAASSVIMLLSPDHRILEFNPEAERLYGKKREDVLGKNYLEMFLPEEAREMVARDIEKVLDGEPTRGFENAVRAFD